MNILLRKNSKRIELIYKYFTQIQVLFHMLQKCLIWPAFAARTTSRGHENSSQTRWSISGSIVLIVVVIRCFELFRSVGNGGTKTLSFTNPQRKKLQTAARSGELGGQAQRATSWVQPVAEAVFHLKML